jgi:hypothetical protein
MKVFYLAELCKLVGNIFLRCLFVYIGDQDDPSFNSCAKGGKDGKGSFVSQTE